jgi:hypothetical protein
MADHGSEDGIEEEVNIIRDDPFLGVFYRES